MESTVLAFVLLAAALHAGWNLMVKMGEDKLVTMGIIDIGSGILCFPLLFFFPLPLVAAWPYVAASAILHVGYKLFLIRAYNNADMGVVYPVARGLSPVLVATGAFLFAGETLSSMQTAAIVAITLAISGLTFTRGWRNIPLVGLSFAFGTSVFIATYTVIDGIGARVAGNAHSFALWMFAIDTVLFTGLVGYLRRGQLWDAAKRHWKPGLAGGAMSTVAYWIVIWAMSISPMAPVSALRETSVLFGALLAGFVLKEGQLALRLTAATVIVGGIVGLQW